MYFIVKAPFIAFLQQRRTSNFMKIVDFFGSSLFGFPLGNCTDPGSSRGNLNSVNVDGLMKS